MDYRYLFWTLGQIGQLDRLLLFVGSWLCEFLAIRNYVPPPMLHEKKTIKLFPRRGCPLNPMTNPYSLYLLNFENDDVVLITSLSVTGESTSAMKLFEITVSLTLKRPWNWAIHTRVCELMTGIMEITNRCGWLYNVSGTYLKGARDHQRSP